MLIRPVSALRPCLATLALIAAPASAWAASTCVSAKPVGLVGYVANPGFKITSIDVQGDYAYTGEWSGAFNFPLRVYRVSDPCVPALVASVGTGQEVQDVAVLGQYAYLANDANGLAIYNVSDPANPVYVANRSDGAYANSIFLKTMPYAFVGYHYSGKMAIYDPSAFPPITNPANYNASQEHVFEANVSGNRAYLMTHGWRDMGLEIVDISNPAAPALISFLGLPSTLYGGLGEIRAQGNYVFMARSEQYWNGHQGGLLVIDASNAASPQLVAHRQITGLYDMDWKGAGLAVEKSRAYLTGKGGLYVFDIATPTAPTLLTTFPVPADFGNAMAGHVEIRENLAYVTIYALDGAAKGGLAIYKLYDLYRFEGFFPPVEMGTPTGAVWNIVKNNSTVPLKFRLYDGETEITDTAVIRQPFKAQQRVCSGGSSEEITLTAAGNSGLRYDTTERLFIYNWKSPASPGMCYVVTVSTVDGNSLSANFQLR